MLYKGQEIKTGRLNDGTQVAVIPCKRCGGSGRYSYCPAYGEMCFRCSGSGREYEPLTRAKNRIDRHIKEAKQRQQYGGLTTAEVREMRLWAEKRAVERYKYSGYTMAELYDMCRWFQSYKKEQELKLKQAHQDSLEYIGTIKKRETFEVVVDRIIPCESFYGTTLLHIMYDLSGNKMIWFCSGNNHGMMKGETYKIKATPKAHQEKEFRGVYEKQTVVTRVALV